LRPASANSYGDSISSNKKLNVVVGTCHPCYTGSETEDDSSHQPGQKLKGPEAQAVERLPSKCEALTSNPSTRQREGGGGQEGSIRSQG
jgi:hypothetical protein